LRYLSQHVERLLVVEQPPSRRPTLRITGVCTILLAVFLAACGSSTSVLASAGGTAGATASGGAGGTVEHSCAVGDTRVCVGPGACAGGQACDPSGEWSPCDCGDQTGSSGSGGSTSATGGQTGKGGASTGDTAGASSGGEAGAAGAAEGSMDEPCPASATFADCSGQCKPIVALVCGAQCMDALPPISIHAGDVILRTPSLSGTRCPACSATSSLSYQVIVLPAEPPAQPLHISIPYPWYFDQPGPSCVAPVAPTQCVPVDANVIKIRTDDPHAKAINVVAESGDCP